MAHALAAGAAVGRVSRADDGLRVTGITVGGRSGGYSVPLVVASANQLAADRGYLSAAGRVFTDERWDLERGGRAADTHPPVRPGDAILAALANVVGAEPGPTNPRAPVRTPMPGLAPIAALRRSVELYAARLRGQHRPETEVVGDVTRLVRHALPADTPDWSAHLLLEAVERWVIAAYGDR